MKWKIRDNSIYLELECTQQMDRQCIHQDTDKRLDDYNSYMWL